MARHQNVSYRARAWNDDNLDGLKRWADAVESEDCRLLGPDTGSRDAAATTPASAPTRSARPRCPTISRGPCRTRSPPSEIHSMIEDFAASAARLQRCGFSGVEISGGHGHLFHQFLSPWSNERTDEYGGDWEGRTRFLRELITRDSRGVRPRFPARAQAPRQRLGAGRHRPRRGGDRRIAADALGRSRLRVLRARHARARARAAPARCARAGAAVPRARARASRRAERRAARRARQDRGARRSREHHRVGRRGARRAGPRPAGRRGMAAEGVAGTRARHSTLRLLQHLLGHDQHASQADRVRQQSARRGARRGRLAAGARADETPRGRRRDGRRRPGGRMDRGRARTSRHGVRPLRAKSAARRGSTRCCRAARRSPHLRLSARRRAQGRRALRARRRGERRGRDRARASCGGARRGLAHAAAAATCRAEARSVARPAKRDAGPSREARTPRRHRGHLRHGPYRRRPTRRRSCCGRSSSASS